MFARVTWAGQKIFASYSEMTTIPFIFIGFLYIRFLDNRKWQIDVDFSG